MLARISRGTAHALDLTFTRGRSPRRFSLQNSIFPTEDSEQVIIDLDVFLHPLHDFLGPWWRYAGQCGRNLQSLFVDDVEQIAQLLLSLESLDEDEDYDYGLDESDDSPCLMNLRPSSAFTGFAYHERPPHRQSPESHPKQQVVIPSSCSSIPTIVITPCESRPRETSSLVPIQDSAFSSQLTVPFHSRFNHTFPPMARSVSSSSIAVAKDLGWMWRNGHWHALVPALDEQMSKGMFSKVVSRRRKGSRHSSRTLHTSASRSLVPSRRC